MINLFGKPLKALSLKGKIGGAKEDRTPDLFAASEVIQTLKGVISLNISNLEKPHATYASTRNATKLQQTAIKSRKSHAVNPMARTIHAAFFSVNEIN